MGHSATRLVFPPLPGEPGRFGGFMAALERGAAVGSGSSAPPGPRELAAAIGEAIHQGRSYRFGGELALGPGFAFDVVVQPALSVHWAVTLTFEERLYDVLPTSEAATARAVEWFTGLAGALDAPGFALMHLHDDIHWLERDFLLGMGLDADVPVLVVGVRQAVLSAAHRRCLGAVVGAYCVVSFLGTGPGGTVSP